MQSQRLIQHTGSAELTIEGKNLKDTLRLLHDDVEYTPLTTTDNSVTFILGDNGTNRIYVNGEYSFGVQISGITIPDILPMYMELSQREGEIISSPAINTSILYSTNCIQYPVKSTEELPYFGYRIGNLVKPFTDGEGLAGVNCEILASGGAESYRYVSALPIDASKPAYITYQGFIVAVFNYQ